MSHITHVRTRIHDREALLQALADLACEAREGRQAGGRTRRPGRERIAVWKRSTHMGTFHRDAPDAPYTLTTERAGGPPDRAFQHRVHQAYARRKILKEARRRNYVVVRESVSADRKIRLVLRKAV